MNKNNNNSLSLVRTFVSADPETLSEANANSSLTYLHRCTHHATLDPLVRSLSTGERNRCAASGSLAALASLGPARCAPLAAIAVRLVIPFMIQAL